MNENYVYSKVKSKHFKFSIGKFMIEDDSSSSIIHLQINQINNNYNNATTKLSYTSFNIKDI